MPDFAQDLALTVFTAVGAAMLGVHFFEWFLLRSYLKLRALRQRLFHRHDWHLRGAIVHRGKKHKELYCTRCPARKVGEPVQR